MHIIGTTSEGKSRFLQHLIQGDIQQGNGLCLLDPSENGDTMYSVLRYCRKIGYEKVCVIDPHLNLTGINPFNRHYKNASVANIMDTVRILFKTADDSDVPRIRRYLPALLRVLWESEMTLYDTLYFSDYENPSYVARRRRIYERLAPLDADLITLEGVFKTYSRWENYFASTVNRLDPFWHSKLGLMFGVKDGVQFDKLVTEKWVILVNLYAGLGFEPIHTRLLGTTIINEILFAIDRLQLHGWKGAYYLYIDEAGRYANRNLAELLNKRKSGLRVTLAHQYFSQFEDRVVLDAVKQMPKIKVMFNTPSHVDRLEMVKALGYGGEITPIMAQFANQDLPKQYAIIKSGKQPPVRVKIPDVPDSGWTPTQKKEFINKINHPWIYTEADVRREIADRFKGVNPVPSRSRKTSNSNAARKTTVWNVHRDNQTPAKND